VWACRRILHLDTNRQVVAIDCEVLYAWQLQLCLLATSAEICYATKESPKTQIKETVTFAISESCDSMTIGSDIWTIDPFGGNYFTTERDGTTVRMSLTSRSITDSALEELVKSYLPTTQE
jgi:hypothetical protein